MPATVTGAARTALGLVLAAVLAAAGPARAHADPDALRRDQPDPSKGPLVSILASRSEITSAIGCVPSDRGTVRLGTEVAKLRAQGIPTTGSLVTGVVRERVLTCTHADGSLMASWRKAAELSRRYGMEFVSHTATYPSDLAALTPEQAEAETCGSAATIDAHGLRGGHGLIAYPGSQPFPYDLQEDHSQRCFAFGRMYGHFGTTTTAEATTPPYIQYTGAPNGGPCNVRTAPCWSVQATGSPRYRLPSLVAPHIAALKAGDWYSIQFYLLVTGRSPAASPIQWDCTSPDPRLHWSNDNERYCVQDFDAIVAMLRRVPGVQFTTPAAAGVAFGRTTPY